MRRPVIRHHPSPPILNTNNEYRINHHLNLLNQNISKILNYMNTTPPSMEQEEIFANIISETNENLMTQFGPILNPVPHQRMTPIRNPITPQPFITTIHTDIPDTLTQMISELLNSMPEPQEDVIISLDRKIIKSMASEKLKDNKFNNESCAICLNKFKPNKRIRKLFCNHVYHKKCIDKWFSTNVKCPICKQDMRELYMKSLI